MLLNKALLQSNESLQAGSKQAEKRESFTLRPKRKTIKKRKKNINLMVTNAGLSPPFPGSEPSNLPMSSLNIEHLADTNMEDKEHRGYAPPRVASLQPSSVQKVRPHCPLWVCLLQLTPISLPKVHAGLGTSATSGGWAGSLLQRVTHMTHSCCCCC